MSDVAIARPAASSRRSSSKADVVMRHLLFVPDTRGTVRESDVHRIFSISIVLSGIRCLISYLLLPIVGPTLGAATGVGPATGIPIGVVALIFDVRGVRRFWLADHRWRWAMTALYAAVMALVISLLVVDIVHAIR
jgi:hypothetical protein